MALAIKCDRCGRMYDNYPINDKPGVGNGVLLIMKSVNNTRQMSATESIDLCCYCMNDLQRFIQNPKTAIVWENNNEKK